MRRLLTLSRIELLRVGSLPKLILIMLCDDLVEPLDVRTCYVAQSIGVAPQSTLLACAPHHAVFSARFLQPSLEGIAFTCVRAPAA